MKLLPFVVDILESFVPKLDSSFFIWFFKEIIKLIIDVFIFVIQNFQTSISPFIFLPFCVHVLFPFLVELPCHLRFLGKCTLSLLAMRLWFLALMSLFFFLILILQNLPCYLRFWGSLSMSLLAIRLYFLALMGLFFFMSFLPFEFSFFQAKLHFFFTSLAFYTNKQFLNIFLLFLVYSFGVSFESLHHILLDRWYKLLLHFVVNLLS